MYIWIFGHFFLKSALKGTLRQTMSIIRRNTTQKLSQDIAKDSAGRQATIHKHGQGNCRIHMAAAKGSDQKDHQCQDSTNDQGITAAGKDSKNKKKGSEVLGEV